jgi:hypothetical protein
MRSYRHHRCRYNRYYRAQADAKCYSIPCRTSARSINVARSIFAIPPKRMSHTQFSRAVACACSRCTAALVQTDVLASGVKDWGVALRWSSPQRSACTHHNTQSCPTFPSAGATLHTGVAVANLAAAGAAAPSTVFFIADFRGGGAFFFTGGLRYALRT